MCPSDTIDYEQLVAHLHGALLHLDDPPYLEKHPLTTCLGFVASSPEPSRGQALRRALRLGIAALDPGSGTTAGGIRARSYQVLYRWAVAQQGMGTIAYELGISRRQAYRDLRQAIEALAQVIGGLGVRDAASPGVAQDGGQRVERMRDELERLARGSDQEVDLIRLMRETVDHARYLAREVGIDIDLIVDAAPASLATNRIMLRQAVLNLLSHAVSRASAGTIAVCVRRAAADALVEVRYTARPGVDEPESANSPYAIARQLLDSLPLRWEAEEAPDGWRRVRIRVPLARERTVLIVDDNEGVIALFRGYLRHQPYRVHGASSADEALRLVQELQPDAIVLDVMMPNRDGWETLQALRAQPGGRRARIVVCSIINDPGLARAMGADAFLNKPVHRAELRQVLAEVLTDAS